MAKKKTTRKKKPAAKKNPQAKKNPPAKKTKESLTNDGSRPCELSQARLKAILDGNFDAHFHKGLKHSEDGSVDQESFRDFVNSFLALDLTGDAEPLAGLGIPAGNRKWVNPQSGWAVDTEMSDPCFHKIPAPPKLDSNEITAEAVELYWMGLLRDIPFAHWNSDANVQDAITELNGQKFYINRNDVNLSPEESPYVSRPIDVKSLFRGGELFRSPDFATDDTPVRENVGPYISQFMVKEIRYGVLNIPQKIVWARSHTDYLITPEDWLGVQDGEMRNIREGLVGEADEDADQRRFISTMRDLATYVHFDQLYQAYLNAALILLEEGYPLDAGNPYGSIENQEGFGTFGGPHILSLVTEVATRALKAVWRQKWTHLRLRPEAYGGLVAFSDPDEFTQIKQTTAFKRNQCRYPSGLMPMAFPEGSPMHPAYGAGHATVAGACVTVLKAFFNESTVVKDPQVASADGQELMNYEEADECELTVGLELDKLAANISIGRNMAGVHWRSDYTQSILLGQRVATDMLFRQCRDYIEDYSFSYTSFGGGIVEISAAGVSYTPPATKSDEAKPTKTVLDGDSFGHPDRILRKEDERIADELLTIV
ncbi:MAG: vanadium-dependent haloperoxidase [Planctomycetota bacterium]